MPLSSPPQVQSIVTGTLIAVDQTVDLNVEGYETAYVTVLGTFSATLRIQLSLNGGYGASDPYVWSWAKVAEYQTNQGNRVDAFTGSNNNTYLIPCSGFKTLRIWAEAFTSGAATIWLAASNGNTSVDFYQRVESLGTDGLTGNSQVPFGGAYLYAANPTGTNDRLKTLADTRGNLRAAIDLARSNAPRRFEITLSLNGAAAAGTNVGGIRKLAANPNVYIYRLKVFLVHSAAGVGSPIRCYRAATVAGGTLIAVGDVPKKKSSIANNTLEFRTGAVTGTKAAQPWLTMGGSEVTTTLQSGTQFEWEAMDVEDMMELTGDDGLIFDVGPIGGDVDDRWQVMIGFEGG